MNIMKNTILNLFIMLGFFFGITSCSEKNEHPKPNERTLPEITFEGKQVLACYVNGELFISEPYEQWLVESYKPTAGIAYDSMLFIRGGDKTVMEGATIGLCVIYDTNKTVYDLGFRSASFRTYFIDNSSLGGKQFSLLKNEPHQMEILYEDENIIAGTFHFTAVSEDGDTVRITDGRYDLKKGL
jgi:hypothetical protein